MNLLFPLIPQEEALRSEQDALCGNSSQKEKEARVRTE